MSGCDHIGDGRAVVRFDYDRDGRMDLAIANSNAPRLVLFHNEIESAGGVVMLSLTGAGPDAGVPESGGRAGSNRDGVGARIEAELENGRTLVRELRCGEGYAAQQSGLIHLGTGDSQMISRIVVKWPSGQMSTVNGIPAGSHVSIVEGTDQPAISSWTSPSD